MGVGLLSCVSIAVLRSLLVVSEDEIDEALGDFRELSDAQASARCDGEALRALDALVRGRRFGGCLALGDERLSNALAGDLPDDRTWRWNVEEGELHDDVAIAADWDGVLPMGKPPYPEESLVPVVREVLTECHGLDQTVTEIASEEVSCSPWQVGRDVADGEYIPAIHLAKVLRVMARDRARDGDGAAALSLLLDGMRLTQERTSHTRTTWCAGSWRISKRGAGPQSWPPLR
jgi:hypothetical protein